MSPRVRMTTLLPVAGSGLHACAPLVGRAAMRVVAFRRPASSALPHRAAARRGDDAAGVVVAPASQVPQRDDGVKNMPTLATGDN